MQMIYGGIEISAPPTCVAVRLTNVGNVPIRLHWTFFFWRVPFGKSEWLAHPMDENGDEHIAAHQYPFALLPNTSDTLFLHQIGRFERHALRILSRGKLPPALAARWLWAYVRTDDGSLFHASLDSTLRKRIRTIAAAGESANARQAPKGDKS